MTQNAMLSVFKMTHVGVATNMTRRSKDLQAAVVAAPSFGCSRCSGSKRVVNSMMKSLFLILFTTLTAKGNAFLVGHKRLKLSSKLKASTSPQAEEAVRYFDKQFPFDSAPPKESSLVNFGVPPVARRNRESKGLSKSTKRFTDIDEPTARKAFAELSKLYGADEALEMVKAYPQALVFSPSRFGPALAAFSEIFGEEDAMAMIRRNPCLLAVSPAQVATSNAQTMFFSYLVGYTRPVGGLLMALLAALVSVPVVEGVTGIPKSELFPFLGL